MEYYKDLSLESIVYFCEVDLIEKTERWKDIIGFENIYQISDIGRVKGMCREIVYKDGRKYTKPAQIKKLTIADNGYLHTMLKRNDKSFYFPVHKSIAMAFFNYIPNSRKIVIDHIDNNKLNNNVYNLQIITSRENNSKDKKNNSSKFTGVFYRKRLNKWRSVIVINYKSIELGAFIDEKEASKCYLLALENIDKYNGNNQYFRNLIKSLLL